MQIVLEIGVSLNLVIFLSRLIRLRHTQKHYATTEALRVARDALPHHPAGRRPSRNLFQRPRPPDLSRPAPAKSARLWRAHPGLVPHDQPCSSDCRARLRGLLERAVAARPLHGFNVRASRKSSEPKASGT